MKISKKQIISITDFFEKYISKGKKYDGKDKLTHNALRYYLYMNGYVIPKRVSFSKINLEKILSGDVLFVKDMNGQIIVYSNPCALHEDNLLAELNSAKNRKITLRNRKNILSEQGLTETNNGYIIPTEYINEIEESIDCKVNRNKKLCNNYKKSYKKGLKI